MCSSLIFEFILLCFLLKLIVEIGSGFKWIAWIRSTIFPNLITSFCIKIWSLGDINLSQRWSDIDGPVPLYYKFLLVKFNDNLFIFKGSLSNSLFCIQAISRLFWRHKISLSFDKNISLLIKFLFLLVKS